MQTRAITEFAIIDGQQVFGNGGGPNTYRGGMAIPGAWRSALLLSDLLGSVPWHGFRQRAGRPVEMLTPTPPLLEQPSPPDSRMTTFSSWALDLIWEGNAVAVIVALSAGWPTAVLPVPARMVGVRRVGRESLSQLPVGSIEYQIGTRTFGPNEVIHFKGPCEPGAVRGLGVLEAHLSETLALVQEQQRQARSVSQHGVPTGVLKVSNPDATEQDLKDAKAGWMATQATRTIAALNSTTDFQPLSWNPEELQLVEARRYSLTDLELIFGLPVGWLGGMNSARQYSNIEMDAVNLLKFTMAGHLARFEQTLSLAFPRGTTVKANLDSVLRADTLTRYQAHQIGLSGGFLTTDEVRELENRPPMPDKPLEPDPFAGELEEAAA
jgi:HK97 family phage portal protein